MDSNISEECTVCYENYDKVLRRPRCLPCGHTLCSICIENTIENVLLLCPNCRTPHSAPSTTIFPINYFVEALLTKLKGTRATRGISDKFRSLVQEEKSCLNSLITGCEEVLSQLGEYREKLRDWKERHYLFQKRLEELNNVAIKLLEEEDKSLVDYITQGKNQVEVASLCFDTLGTDQSAITADGVEDWIQKCKQRFPDSNTVFNSMKVQETMREALEIMTTKAGVTAASIHLRDSASSITERIEHITGRFSLEQLSVDGGRRMSESINRLVEAGRVLAVQDDQYGRRSAKLTLQDGQLHIHPLLRQPTPTHNLQYCDLVDRLDEFYNHVFLDLGWAGSTRGRVMIELNSDTPLGKQFEMLCTGQQGPTYLNTRLFRVEDKGRAGERVFGGDYESNDGRGGASLLPNMGRWYSMASTEGHVWSWNQEINRGAQFAINTNNFTIRGSVRLICLGDYPCVFGKVVSGLDVVRAAINHSDITEVTVVDCGVVMPHYFTVPRASHVN